MTLIRRALIGMLATGVGVLALAMSGRMTGFFDVVRRALTHVGVWLALALLVAAPARADELSAAGGGVRGLVIHGPDEVLAGWCSSDGEGRLWLALPGGARFELVTSTSDPAIVNPGDGTFHPFDPAEVRAALDAVTFPLGAVSAHVFVLPFPRRLGLESAAGPGLILLSPGVLPIAREVQHAEVAHELGHVVQHAVLPDTDLEGWQRYRDLRGIGDVTRYSADGAHADRPHEIFAEDFRALFGGSLANYAGTIENATLAHPNQVAGLEGFLRGLSFGLPAATSLRAWPNPARGPLTFARAGATATALDLFDAAGRRIVTLPPGSSADRVTWRWDGRDEAGGMVPAGVLLARARDGGPALKFALLP